MKHYSKIKQCLYFSCRDAYSYTSRILLEIQYDYNKIKEHIYDGEMKKKNKHSYHIYPKAKDTLSPYQNLSNFIVILLMFKKTAGMAKNIDTAQACRPQYFG